MIKIVIADDHQIVIDGLKSLLEKEEHIKIVGEALNGVILLNRLPMLNPDVVLLDIGMPVMDGMEAATKIKDQFPAIKIVAVSAYTEVFKIKRMLKIGIDAYVLKDTGKRGLLEAIESVMKGGNYYDPRVKEILMDSFNSKKRQTYAAPLTKREKEITGLIAEGYTTKEIADKLFVSPLTVDTHRKNIFSKLGIKKVAELVRYAVLEGLVD